VLDLEPVPRRVDIADWPTPRRLLSLAIEPRRSPRPAPGGKRHPCHKLGLHVGDPPLAAVGLNQADDGNVVVHGMQEVQKQLRQAVVARQVL
jgi:hypothetical protein